MNQVIVELEKGKWVELSPRWRVRLNDFVVNPRETSLYMVEVMDKVERGYVLHVPNGQVGIFGHSIYLKGSGPEQIINRFLQKEIGL